jgi:hypothetical protein
MGLYKQARRALENALRINESIGARRSQAYDLSNLGWTAVRGGDNRTARRLLEEAMAEMTRVGDELGRASCLLYLAHTAEAAGDAAGAARRFGEAREALGRIEMPALMLDCTAGLARSALAQGELNEARAQAEEVWQYLSERGTEGIELPTLCYLTCADVFDALGEAEASRAAVEAGYHELMARAEKISNAEWRKSFLENVPEHRAMLELWERASGSEP